MRISVYEVKIKVCDIAFWITVYWSTDIISIATDYKNEQTIEKEKCILSYQWYFENYCTFWSCNEKQLPFNNIVLYRKESDVSFCGTVPESRCTSDESAAAAWRPLFWPSRSVVGSRVQSIAFRPYKVHKCYGRKTDERLISLTTSCARCQRTDRPEPDRSRGKVKCVWTGSIVKVFFPDGTNNSITGGDKEKTKRDPQITHQTVENKTRTRVRWCWQRALSRDTATR